MRRTQRGRQKGWTGKRGLFLLCALSAMALLVSCSQWDYMTGRAPAGESTISPKVTERDLERLVESIRPIRGNPDSQYRLAMHYQKRDRHDEALKKFWKAVSIDPEHVNAFIGMGISYDATGRYSKAQQAYRLALKVDPDSDFALNNLGYSCFLEGRYECAVEALEEAVALNPEKKRYRNNLGRAYLERGEYGKAYGQFRLGMEEASANFLMGHSLYEKRMYGEAGEYFARAVAADPGMKGARKGLEAARALAEITEPDADERPIAKSVLREEVPEIEGAKEVKAGGSGTAPVAGSPRPERIEESAVNAEAAPSIPAAMPAGRAALKEAERVMEVKASAGGKGDLPSTEGSIPVPVRVQATAVAASPASSGEGGVAEAGRAVEAEGRIPEGPAPASTSIEIEGKTLSAEGESQRAAAGVTAVLTPAEEKVLNALPVREEPEVAVQEPAAAAEDSLEDVELTVADAPAPSSKAGEAVSALPVREEPEVAVQEPAAAAEDSLEDVELTVADAPAPSSTAGEAASALPMREEPEVAVQEPAASSTMSEAAASALPESEELKGAEPVPDAATGDPSEVAESSADGIAREPAAMEAPAIVETAARGEGERGEQTPPPLGKRDDEFVLVRCHVKQGDERAVTVLQFMRLSAYLDTVQIEIVGSRGAGGLAAEMKEYLQGLGYGRVTLLGEDEQAHSKTKLYYSDEYLQPAFRVAKDIPGYQEMESTGEPSAAGTTVRIVVGSDMKSYAGIFRQREKFAYSVRR